MKTAKNRDIFENLYTTLAGTFSKYLHKFWRMHSLGTFQSYMFVPKNTLFIQGWRKCTLPVYADTPGTNVPHLCHINVHELKLSVRFVLWPAVFRLQAMLRQFHQNDIEQCKVKGIHTCIWITKFQIISLYNQPLSSYRSVGDKSTKWTQNDIENYTPNGTPMVNNRFRVKGHYETSASDLQSGLGHYRPNVYSICVTSVPDSQLNCCVRVTGYVETSEANHPQMTLNITRLICLICMLLVSPSYKCPYIELYKLSFLVRGHFEANVSTYPKVTLGTTRPEIPMYLISVLEITVISVLEIQTVLSFAL